MKSDKVLDAKGLACPMLIVNNQAPHCLGCLNFFC